MGDLRANTGAAVRAADALLHAAGGRAVFLRMPSPAIAADVTEQLGLALPEFHDAELAPVVFRRARATVSDSHGVRFELLVSASAVRRLVGSLAFDSASVLLGSALGVVSNDELLAIEAVTVEQVNGAPYCYRLIVQAPRALIT